MSIWSRSRRKCLVTGGPLTSVPLVLPRSSRNESARIVTTAACSPLTAGYGEADVVVRTAPDRDALPIEPDVGRRAVGQEVDELAHGPA